MPEIVPLPRPEIESIIRGLEKLIERTRAEEFECVVVMAFAANGDWLVKEFGKGKNKLEKIGLLETLKTDFIKATETDIPTGL